MGNIIANRKDHYVLIDEIGLNLFMPLLSLVKAC